MRWTTLILCLAAVALAGPAMATPTITVGENVLRPDMAHQPLYINVTGGDLVQGLNFVAQIGDGSGPRIESVDILTGTLFASNNTGQRTPAPLPPTIFASTTTATGTVAAMGRLATLWVDTTGFDFGMGPWSLNLAGTADGSTDFAGINVNITNGLLALAGMGDANKDGLVDVGDLGILGANYGTATGATWATGDFTGDGAVDVGDLGVLGANYVIVTSGSVPEPMTLSLLAIGALGLLRKRS